MIELKPEQVLDDWYGFTVYDAITGDPIKMDDDDFFMFDEYGQLVWASPDDCGHYLRDIPKEGKYLIQFADSCKYLKW